MGHTAFWALAAMIHAAPHIDQDDGIALSIVFLGAAALAAFLELRK